MAVSSQPGQPPTDSPRRDEEASQNDVDELRRQAQVLEEELQRIYQSPSWHAAERIRRLRTELKLLAHRVLHPLQWLRSVASRRIPYSVRSRIVQTIKGPAAGRPAGAMENARRFAAGLTTADQPRRARPTIICLSTISWDLRIQRPQHILARLAARGWPVLYAHPAPAPGAREPEIDADPVAPGVRTFHLPTDHPLEVGASPMRLEDLRVMSSGMARLRTSERLGNAIVLCHSPFWRPLAVVLRKLYGWPIVYDRMDRHGAFTTESRQMEAEDVRLAGEADLVTASARALAAVPPTSTAEVLLLPNACEPGDWAAAVPGPEMAPIPGPVIGFYGAVADWVDTDLLAELALARPGWSLVLIGATWSGDVSRLERLENVHLLGERPYSDLPALAAGFDVGVIPFKRNALTEAANPVKVYEMLALGLPVVATALPELEPLGHLIRRASGRDGFLKAIEEAIKEPRSSQLREDRRTYAERNSWGARVDALETALVGLHPMVSIAVVTYNNLELTKLCLESIERFTEYPNYEILVVDNGSTDGTRRWLAEEAARRRPVRIFLNDSNAGFAAANNQAFSEAGGEIFCLLNNDTIVTRGWLSAMVRTLREHPEVGMVGPSSNGVANEARVAPGYETIGGLQEWAEEFAWRHDGKGFSIQMLALFCAAARREVWEEVGGLDERFEVGMFEDDDLSRRVRRAGYDIQCLRSAWVHHFQQASFGELPEEEYARIFEANRKRYSEKWSGAQPDTVPVAGREAERAGAEESRPGTPAKELRGPVYDSAAHGRGPMLETLGQVTRYKDLLRLLVGTHIKMRYKRSLLGVAWTLLNPLATAIVMTVAFSALFRFSLPNYAVYVLSGILFWTFFQQSTTQSMTSLVWGAGLLKKVYVPAAVFPLSAIGTGLINLGLSVPALLLIMAVLKHPFTWALLFVPVAAVLIVTFAFGVGLIMSSLAVYFSDVVEMYGVLLRIWFYLTPIMYPEKILPARVLWLVKINPMYHFATCWRDPIYSGTLPPAHSLLVSLAWAAGALLLGWWVFSRRADEFALRA